MSDRHAPLRLHLAFAALGAAFLAMFAWVFMHEYFAEWRVQQARFGQLQTTLKDSHALSLAAPVGAIRQVWLPDLDRVDRCSTCHLGIDDPTFAGAAQPFSTHPGTLLNTHPPERFGCSVCHGGQGSATTYRDAAHDPIPHWPDPMRAGDLLQANCGVCHRDRRPPAAPVLAAGRALVAAAGCAACHDIPGFSADDVQAPALDNSGAKLRSEWLRTWLADPAATLPGARMPDFRLSEEDIEALSAYLLAQRRNEPTGPETDWSAADARRGAALFDEAQCRTCHRVGGTGGILGPDLSSIGRKARRDWLVAFLQDPQREQPRTLMPQYRLAADEARDLVAFLAPAGDAAAPGAEPVGRGAANARRIARGREAFTRLGCEGCHRTTTAAAFAKIGPPLAGIGDRPADGALEPAGPHEPPLAVWLRGKIRTPEAATPGSRMPSFRFTEAQATAMVVALLSLRRADLPASRVSSAPPQEPFRPQGPYGALISRYRCLSCHTLRGSGGELASVPLDRIGSQLQRAYLSRYLERPWTVRRHMDERMPRFFMTKPEAEALATYLAGVFVDDRFETPIDASPARARRGEELFGAFECLNCHSLRGRGAQVGPDLTGVGRKLKPGWIRAWLMTPETWKPGTLHPSLGLSDADARSLAAFLLTQTGGPALAGEPAGGAPVAPGSVASEGHARR